MMFYNKLLIMVMLIYPYTFGLNLIYKEVLSMKKKEITDQEAIGKTIEKFVYSSLSEQMVITFSDNTFTTFGVKTKYLVDSLFDEERVVNKKINIFTFGDTDLIKNGIF